MKTVSLAEMRELDRRTIEEFGIHGDVLMERAGQGVAEITLDVLDARRGNSVLLVAGTGNNGGDVFAAASFLADADVNVVMWICGSKQKIKGDAEYHLKKMIRRGIHPVEVQRDEDFDLDEVPIVIVDGLLGTGSKGAPRGFMTEVINFINEEARRSFILSVDIPSGVDADTGIAEGHAVQANLTATMGLPKTGLVRPEAIPYVGNVEVIDIGIPAKLKEQAAGSQDVELIERTDLLIPLRGNDSHKGTYGHVLLIGGSKGFTGAIAMAARAALRSGAGLVSVLTPEEVYPIVAQACGPEVMVHSFPMLGKLKIDFSKEWKNADAVLVGPGIGRTEATKQLVETLLEICNVPLGLDADALCVSPEKISAAKCPVVLTPHPKEFERLFGAPVTNRLAQARAAADLTDKTLILKGAGTVVADPKYKMGINLSGNPGMATGGSGDVLSGILAALLCRYETAFEAATTAVHLHGLTGDIAAEMLGQESLIATDLIEVLPEAFRIIQFS